jgi:endonuclease/exonuclease/phosphatase family metal-dependent hydrolase
MPAVVEPGVLRVLQLNVGSLLEPHWDRRRHEILAWLDRLDPDVVCLEEIWEDGRTENTATWLVRHAPADRWYHVFGGHSLPETVWPDASLRFGSAVLSRWPIDAHHVELLPPDGPFPWELLHARTAGLDVFAVHLAAAPVQGPGRVRQVVAIDDAVRRLSDPVSVAPAVYGGPPRESMPPIVCGDFNAEPDSDEIRFLCSLHAIDGRSTFYQDAWRMAGEGPGYTQDWRTNPIAAGMNINRKRIDYVFVGDPFLRAGGAGRVLRAELACHEPLTGILASDHVGVVVDVVWPQRP